ncbi:MULTISPECIES: histone-like nucleoid-structuring protein Lsr2 [unclassified Streptomyces]|uniref:Lsr2 family DNA-binding protein n=1 Tax=unclassified Streptomyces TaxID=2593676 RepID=UPI0034501AAE
MFDDFDQSAKATALALITSTGAELNAAARAAARRARDKDDLTQLLDVLGLPADETTLTDLIPLLPETGDAPMTTNPANPAGPAWLGHHAGPRPMYANGRGKESRHEGGRPTAADPRALGTTSLTAPPSTTGPVIDVPVIPLPGTDPVQGLIEWAAAHPAASVRKRAARITTDLADLSARRESEAVQRDAEDRVARARADLERAEQELKALKSGARPISAPAAVHTSGAYTRDELAAIRTWARAHGHQVADRGLPSKVVLDAYAAAHPATPARKAG